MEAKRSIIGGICITPINEPERMGGLNNVDDVTDLIPSVLFDVEKHYSIGLGDPYEKWYRTYGSIKNTKWGQMKLLLGEIDFLCRYWDPSVIPNPQVLYVGAAPGTHIGILADLFPAVTFNLYDTGQNYDMKVLESKTNVLRNGKFEVTDEWKNRRQEVFLWSDIRNLTYNQKETLSDTEAKENERVVWEDMKLQESWVEDLQPVKAFIKFRLPYSYDFNTKKSRTRSYLDGIVYRQAWAPATSTECRLVPHNDFRKRDWDYEHHEGQMFYHNKNIRPKVKFYNPVTRTNEVFPPETGLDTGYDSTLTLTIIMGYLKKFNLRVGAASVLKLFKILNDGAAAKRANLHKLRISPEETVDDDDRATA